MSISEHVQHTVSVCNQRLYLLCQLKWQNLPAECLDRIFDAIVIYKLMYASLRGLDISVWSSLISLGNYL